MGGEKKPLVMSELGCADGCGRQMGGENCADGCGRRGCQGVAGNGWKLLQSNWGLRIWIIGHRSSKFNFDLMGNSLSPLHALGKFREVNRNYLPAFHKFPGFSPCYFNLKFTTILLWTLNGELD